MSQRTTLEISSRSTVVRRFIVLGLGFATLASVAACRGSAPVPAPAPSSTSPEPATTVTPTSRPSSSPSAVASVGIAASPAASSAAPLVGPDGSALPQTEDKPSITSPAFRERIELVARAILNGDPTPAHAAFFPLVAYRQVKAIKDPDRDYERRLVAAFDRDVAEYHQALGKDAAGASYAGIDVPEARAEWIKPGREGNKVGYHRVLRSKLRFALASGKERTFDLTSMISWRGEWYVVHLHGFD